MQPSTAAPESPEPRKSGAELLRAHPQWTAIHSAMIARIMGGRESMDAQQICEKYDVRTASGILATGQVLRYMQALKKKYAGAFEAAKEVEKKVIRERVFEMFQRNFELAAGDHQMAMSAKKIVKNGRKNVEMPNPDFDAAKGCREDMTTVAKSLGEVAGLKDEPEQQPGNTLINPVFGNQRIQLMAMPKSVPSRAPIRVIEAQKESA